MGLKLAVMCNDGGEVKGGAIVLKQNPVNKKLRVTEPAILCYYFICVYYLLLILEFVFIK